MNPVALQRVRHQSDHAHPEYIHRVEAAADSVCEINIEPRLLIPVYPQYSLPPLRIWNGKYGV